jgi:hypothetical protein
VQRDVVSRLSQPCTGHADTAAACQRLQARLEHLEAVVAAQDGLIQRLAASAAAAQRAADTVAAAAESAVTAEGVQARIVAATAGLVTPAQLSAALSGKADAALVASAVRDLHALNGDVAARVTQEEAAALVDRRVSSAVSALRASVTASSDATTRSVAELRKAIDVRAGRDEGALGGAGGGAGGGGGGAGAWKAKVASITATYEAKLATVREGLLAEVRGLLKTELGEVVEALNRKAYKSEVAAAVRDKVDAAALATALEPKVGVDEVRDALAVKAGLTDVDALRTQVASVAAALTPLQAAVAQLTAAGLRPPHATLSLSTSIAGPGGAASAPSGGGALSDGGWRLPVSRLEAAVEHLRAELTHQVAALAQQLPRPASAGEDAGDDAGGGGGWVDADASPWPASGSGSGGDSTAASPPPAAAALPPLPSGATASGRQSSAPTTAVPSPASTGVGIAGTHGDPRDGREGAHLAPRSHGASTTNSAGAGRAAPPSTPTPAVTALAARVSALAEEVALLSAGLTALEERGAPAGTALLPARTAMTTLAPSPAPTAGLPVGVTMLGRWVWKTRRLWESGFGPLVAWDMEAVNTARDQLTWAGVASGAAAAGTVTLEDAAIVTAVKPGLYKASLAFFASEPPAVTLMVNGSAALSTPAAIPAGVGAAGVLLGPAVLHAHPSGSVAGVTLVHFLALPPAATLGVLYDGKHRGQGFLELAKL